MNRLINIVLTLVVVVGSSLSSVRAADPALRDSLILRRTLHYDINRTFPDKQQREVLDSMVVWMDHNRGVNLKIFSYTDLSGEVGVNEYISQFRAENVIYYMSKEKPSGIKISPTRFSYESREGDIRASSDSVARRVDIYQVVKVARPTIITTKEPTVDIAAIEQICEETEVKSIEEVVSVDGVVLPEEASLRHNYRHFSWRTNLLYWAGCAANIGFEWRPGRGSVGILLNGGYAPLSYEDWGWKYCFGGFFVSPEIRGYMGYLRRGYLGVQLLGASYNVRVTETGYQGELYGVGLVGGYRTRLSDALDIDFSIGIGGAEIRYDSYEVVVNNLSLYVDEGVKKRELIPLQLGVSLIWGGR